jgi:hypothetical protein
MTSSRSFHKLDDDDYSCYILRCKKQVVVRKGV